MEKAWMVCLGFQPGTRGWYAQTKSTEPWRSEIRNFCQFNKTSTPDKVM